MKLLVAPLNWGLGHASRCVPLIKNYLAQGDEVVIAGDGVSLALLRKHFPELPYVNLPALDIRYSSSGSQVWAMIRAFPAILMSALRDHAFLEQLLKQQHFDLVISDNRFGFHTKQTRCVYITHQVFPRLPQSLAFLQPLAARIHRRVIRRYHECWIPDYEQIKGSLAGGLSHGERLPENARYIGPLSRFTRQSADGSSSSYQTVAVVSGPEPQRTLFEQQVMARLTGADSAKTALVVRGLPQMPSTKLKKGNITLVSHLDDDRLAAAIRSCKTVICRSGYSTVMDLAALGALDKAEFYPTSGQPEQEYLFEWLKH